MYKLFMYCMFEVHKLCVQNEFVCLYDAHACGLRDKNRVYVANSHILKLSNHKMICLIGICCRNFSKFRGNAPTPLRLCHTCAANSGMLVCLQVFAVRHNVSDNWKDHGATWPGGDSSAARHVHGDGHRWPIYSLLRHSLRPLLRLHAQKPIRLLPRTAAGLGHCPRHRFQVCLCLLIKAPSTPATMSNEISPFRQSRNKLNMFSLFRLCRKDEISFHKFCQKRQHCCQKRQQFRSNIRLRRRNHSTCSIRRCCFDIVAGVDGA